MIAYVERLRRGDDETSEDRCAELEAKLAEREAFFVDWSTKSYERQLAAQIEADDLREELGRVRGEADQAIAYANRCAELVDEAGVRLGIRSLREVVECATEGGECRVSIHELAEAAARLRRLQNRVDELESLREAQKQQHRIVW